MSWQKRRCNVEGFGRPEPFFFLCEERTYSPLPEGQRWYPSRWSGRALFPKHPPDASPEGADNAAVFQTVVIACAAGRGPLPVCRFAANCCPLSGQPATRLRKPATAQGTPFGCGSFVAVMDDATPHRPFSFAAPKETKPPLTGAERK